jgi:segregation and condensation protein B
MAMAPRHIVEAALFSAGKPLSVEEISQQTNLPPDAVKDACKELAKEYDSRDTVLEVGKAGAKWAMQVRPQAAEPATKFAPPEIPSKLLKTLALIAYHQPMKQSELVDMIGTKVYDHVPELVGRGLVKAREEGVTKILVTTPLFPEYFGLDAEDREQVRATMAKLVGLPPPPKKAAEPVVDEGGANVPEASAPGETAEPAPEGSGEGGAEAAAPTPTTS